jgi:tetratricopeptide (TPR) repeat protein
VAVPGPETAIAANDSRPVWPFRLGRLRDRMVRGAAAAYRAVRTRNARIAKRHFRLAMARTRLGDWPGAAAALEAAIARDGGKAKWHVWLGKARAKIGDWSGAAQAYDAAIALDDTKAQWHFNLGVIRAQMGDLSGAVAAYEAALARDDSRSVWHGHLGRMLSKVRDWRGAVEAYQAAVARDADNADWCYGLGVAQGRLGNWAAAATAYQAAARDAGDADLHFRTGTARAKIEDWTEAAKAYRNSFNLDPNNDQFRYRLGACLARSGQEAEARTILAPLEVKSDALLETFLPSAQGATKTTLSVSGARTVLARRIAVASQSEDDYFEHLKLGDKGCRRISAFYASLTREFGHAAPDFVPRLHYDTSRGPYWYFLYEYIDITSNLELEFGRTGNSFDLQIAEDVIGSLVQISTKFQDVFDREGTSVHRFSQDSLRTLNVERHLCREIGGNKHDRDYSELLRDVLKRWPDHYSHFRKLPEVPCRGDVAGENFVLSSDRRLRVIDWEYYGRAPIGLDLVMLFVNRLDHPEFERLLDAYFDGIAGGIGPDERRYIVALLAIFATIIRARPLPRKWLHYLGT